MRELESLMMRWEVLTGIPRVIEVHQNHMTV